VNTNQRQPSPTPKDAAAVILLRQNTDPQNPEVFLVRRSEKLAFLGGFSAFPGGQLDSSDAGVEVRNSTDAVTSAAISCAARELFEELGILVARGAESLTKGQRVSLLDDLESGRMSWPGLLQHYNLFLDADDFTFVGRWVTPHSVLVDLIPGSFSSGVLLSRNQKLSRVSLLRVNGSRRGVLTNNGGDQKSSPFPQHFTL